MNIIDAIINLVNNPMTKVLEYYQGNNRANNAGAALEEYVKDLFANSFNCTPVERNEKINEVFSYLGNNSNPPDAMLKYGDAIEVKKIENNTAPLELNSSNPKHKLYASNNMITTACRNAENWTEKDIIYITGVVRDNQIKHLSMVYGLDYCASEEVYLRVKHSIKHGVETIPDVEFSDTKELGRVNRVDPLGITNLRIRGMWLIDNPWSVFDYIYLRNMDNRFNFMCVINDDKWNTFSNTYKLYELSQEDDALKIQNVRIKNPDNPAQLRNAKLITYEIE